MAWQHSRHTGWLAAAVLVAALACDSTPQMGSGVSQVGAGRRYANLHRGDGTTSAQLAQDTGPAAQPQDLPSRPVKPADTRPAKAGAEISFQIPDPTAIETVLNQEKDKELGLLAQRVLSAEDRQREEREINTLYARFHDNILAKSGVIRRPKQVELRLADVIRRTLQSNYAIQVRAYDPAIETTKIVEAEAQFDAVYFGKTNYSRLDRPTSSALVSSQSDQRDFETGVKKLLSTGTQIQVSYALSRTWTNLTYQTLNPSYADDFAVEFRQPFLKGFGLDVNRSQIEIRKLDRAISIEKLRKDIIDAIHNTEQAYWTLAQARRRVAISARLLTNLELILQRLEQRKAAGYDVYGVQLNLTTSRIEQRRADFIRRCNDVKNAETALLALMNDPEMNLAEDYEVIPVDTMSLEPIVVDELGEVAAALTYRSELHQAKHAIEQAQLAIGVAKNQALPKLDVIFRYLIDGMGSDAHGAFSQMWDNRFNEYVVGLEFEYPIGDRGPEAALRRARLQQAQAITSHRAQIENAIREVRQAVRDLNTGYEQIGPSLRAAEASLDQLRATRARQEKLDPPSLQVELDAHETLASTRDSLLQVLANYNIALSNLEKQKGTLLQYNNVVIRGVDDKSYEKPYQPTSR
ncbi:MAG: TolC family protein [Phycisphaerae bacterium]|nr:TolC family protein [Phycisphaerae bacterium]